MKSALNILGILGGLIISLWAPPSGLTAQAMQALGLLFWDICAWIGQVYDDYIVALFMAVTFLLRFVMVSINALLALLMLILVPIGQAVGMSAWVLGMIIHLSAHGVFVMLYQNIVYAVGYEAAGRAISAQDGAKFSLIFAGISFVAVLLAIPYWRWLGLL